LGASLKNVKKLVSVFPRFKNEGFSVFLNDYLTSSGISLHRFGHEIGISLYCLDGNSAWASSAVGETFITAFLRLLIHLLSIRAFAKPKKSFVIKHVGDLSKAILRSILYQLVFLIPSSLRFRLRELVWLIFRRMGGKLFLLKVPQKHFEKLESTEFYGMNFFVPSLTQKYLEFRYGKDWRIPKKKWVHHKDDGAIVPVSIFPEIRL